MLSGRSEQPERISVLVDVHLLERRRLAEAGHPLHLAAERDDEGGAVPSPSFSMRSRSLTACICRSE
jgi:hypothetical protein